MAEHDKPSSPEEAKTETAQPAEPPPAEVASKEASTGEPTSDVESGTPAADAATPEAKPRPKPKREEPKRTAPRLSAFSALEKFLTPEQRSKLAAGPEEPTVTVETSEGRRSERRPSFGDKRGDSRGRRPDQRGDRRPDQRGDRRPDQRGDRRPDQRSDQRGDRRPDSRGGPSRDRGRQGPGNDRGVRRGDTGRPAPTLATVLNAAEKTGQQEAGFAQGLVQALEAEVARFAAAVAAIDSLNAPLRDTATEQAQRMLEVAKRALDSNVDGSTPITIGVVGGVGAGKTTLIEALAGDAGTEIKIDEAGRASTIWRGIRFAEQGPRDSADGIVEVRSEGAEEATGGRPLIVIENIRVNLHDGFVFDNFLRDPDSFLGPEPTDDEETTARVHLAAFNLATRPEHKTRSNRLLQASRFSQVEGLLARRLQTRAKLLRTQRFIDNLIDAVVPLRDFALTVNLQSHLEAKAWQARLADMGEDMARWADDVRKSVAENARQPFESLRGQIEAFVNKHAGDRNADELWAKRLAALDLPKHVETELARVHESFSTAAAAQLERIKSARQPSDGPLPQPVLMTHVPQEFREATGLFRSKLAGVSDPRLWVTAPNVQIPATDPIGTLPLERDRALAAVNKQVAKLEKRLVEELTGKLAAAYMAPVERRLTADSRAILDAQFSLGREAHTMLDVVNEVLLSLVQRLIERAADNYGVKLPLIQKIVREPGHRTKLLVPPGRDLFLLARRLQSALGERVDLVPSVDRIETRIANALLPAKIKPYMVTVNEEKRMAQVRIPRTESGKAFGRNGTNQRLAAALIGYHLHLRIAKEKELKDLEAAEKKRVAAETEARKTAKAAAKELAESPAPAPETAEPAAVEAQEEVKPAKARVRKRKVKAKSESAPETPVEPGTPADAAEEVAAGEAKPTTE